MCHHLFCTSHYHGDFGFHERIKQPKLHIRKIRRAQKRPVLWVKVFHVVDSLRINCNHDTGFYLNLTCTLHTKIRIDIFNRITFLSLCFLYIRSNQTLFQAGL